MACGPQFADPWPRGTKRVLINILKNLFYLKNIIENDLQYLESIKTDRLASYGFLHKTNVKRMKNANKNYKKNLRTIMLISDYKSFSSCRTSLNLYWH